MQWNIEEKNLVNNPITKHMERIINQHKEILYYFLNKKYWIDVQTWNEYEIKLNENSRAQNSENILFPRTSASQWAHK